MAKAIETIFYFFSAILYYAFFFSLIGGHFYFYKLSLDRADCFASSDKSNLIAQSEGDTNVSKNFRVVNMMGFITFTVLTAIMIWLHTKLSFDQYYRPHECTLLLFAVFMVVWCSYYLTLLTMRLRHTGMVCSGDYLDQPHLFIKGQDAPYIHDEGLFLWYAMIAQAGFVVVMISGAASIAN